MRLPGIMIAILFAISFFCDLYIWNDIRHYAHRKKLWGRIYAVSSLLCWIFLIVTVCLPRRAQDADIIPVMWMLYSYLTVYLSKLVYVVISLLGRIPRLWKARRVNSGLWVGLPLSLLLFVALWWGSIITRHEIQVNRVDIESDRLPEAFNGYTVAQFSDAHVGTWGKDTLFISTLVDSINALHPDLIVFTGDIVNRSTPELEPFLKVFRRLHAPDGVVSILGNHDYGDYMDWDFSSEKVANRELLLAWQRQMGWKVLNNDHTLLIHGNDTVPLIGVENWGEPPFKQYGNLEKAYPVSRDSHWNLNDGRFKILLSHNPEHWRQEVSQISNIDLTLSGHTHAMQFILSLGDWKWSPAKYKYEQWGGLYETLNPDGIPSRIYVNVGSGEVGMPFRIGATPEITFFTLRSAHKK